MENKYIVQTNYDDVVGVYKIKGETKFYYKISENTYINKKTMRARGEDCWSCSEYKLVSDMEAHEIIRKIKCIRTLIKLNRDDWKKLDVISLMNIIQILETKNIIGDK